MPNIIINEQDLTSPGTAAETTDIAYVIGFPGLVNVYIDALPATGEAGIVYRTGSQGFYVYQKWDTSLATPAYAVISPVPYVFQYPASTGSWFAMNPFCPVNTPTLCSTKEEFEATFGSSPLIWATAQVYPTFDGSGEVSGNMYAIGDLEKSYIYAEELLNLGLPVLYEAVTVVSSGTTATPTVTQVYSRMSADDGCFESLSDKGDYTVKYITSGAYPTFEYSGNAIVTKMVNTAETRGDSVALIDHSNKPSRALYPVSDSTTVYYALTNSTTAVTSTYATMFTPWGVYNCPTSVGQEEMPASFGYLASLAKAIQTNSNWLAMAGVSRGIVPNLVALSTDAKLSNAIADAYQPRTGKSLNAITNIRPYGLTIWGNRTLKNNTTNLTATSFLNIRNLVSDVKKVTYSAALSLMYEHNSDVLWSRFKALIAPTLDQMTTGYGLSGYQIIKGTTTEKAKLVASIKLYPMYAIEDFEITVVMSDEEVTVE